MDSQDLTALEPSPLYEKTHKETVVDRNPAKSLSVALPENPIVTIRPRKKWAPLNLHDLWASRDLLYFLTLRDVKVRYKQTLLGASWAILQPLFTMVIFTILFGRFAGIPSDGIPYPLFAFSGLLPWTFFSNSLTNSGNSLVGSANLVTKVYFPRVIIPVAAVLAGLVDFAISFVILTVLMCFYHPSIGKGLFLIPVLIIHTVLLAIALGMYISALNVKYRDVRYALPFLIQIWMFVTPIIYPTTIVPVKYRWIAELNPLTGLINGYRSALFARPFDAAELTVSAILSLAMLTYSMFMFHRMEASFADII